MKHRKVSSNQSVQSDLFDSMDRSDTLNISYPEVKRPWLKPVIIIAGIVLSYFTGTVVPLCDIMGDLCR